jgi:hypothetical protein
MIRNATIALALALACDAQPAAEADGAIGIPRRASRRPTSGSI